MSSLADLGFTEVDKKIPERKCKIKQILIGCFLVGVFLLALVALGLAAHCRSFFREEPDAVDLPSTQQLKQNFQTKDVTLPKGSLYGKCDDVHNMCENEATCLMVGPSKDHHICLCNAMYYGRFCQHKIIPQKKSFCNDTICLNSGTCIDIGQEEFACLCKHGFHGTRCEETWTVDENETATENSGLCYKGLCLNSGTCIDVNDNNFACLCQYGYKGSRCEQTIVVDQEKIVTGCASNVCENQGTCLQTKNTFICLCKFGFFGGNCQHGIKETTFRVTLSKWENRATNKKTIKWNRIISNPGGCYDQSNGCYTAPISGTYKFSVQKYGNNKQGSFDVLLDSKQIIYTRHKDPSESFHSATSSFILHLNKGQQVQIQNEISTIVYGTHNNGYISSWFEGHLLYPD